MVRNGRRRAAKMGGAQPGIKPLTYLLAHPVRSSFSDMEQISTLSPGPIFGVRFSFLESTGGFRPLIRCAPTA